MINFLEIVQTCPACKEGSLLREGEVAQTSEGKSVWITFMVCDKCGHKIPEITIKDFERTMPELLELEEYEEGYIPNIVDDLLATVEAVQEETTPYDDYEHYLSELKTAFLEYFQDMVTMDKK